MELSEWENINRLLKRHGCSAVRITERDGMSGEVTLDLEASQALRLAIKSLVEDTERRQNLIHGLIQTNNQLKEDVRLQQDRARRQEQRAKELQRILDDVRAKIRDLEDNFIAKMQQQASVANFLQEKKDVHDRCQKHKEKLREQEENIKQLRKRLSLVVCAEEQRAANQKKAFLRLMNREPRENNILDQQVLDVIDGYERRVNQLQTELRRYESLDVPVLERKSSDASLDLDTTPNYKALIKSYQEQIREARRKNEELVRENDQIKQEMESRPSAKEFQLCKQQIRKLEKILLKNNIRVRGIKKEKKDESSGDAACTGVKSLDLLPAAECRLHLQNVCQELNVQDLKDLVPTAASNLEQARTHSKLHKILSDISLVISGPRAPQLLYKHNPRAGGHPDESNFIHLLPTVEQWAGQLLSLKALHRALRKLSEKLLPDQILHNFQDSTDSIRVEELLFLVDTMLEDVESRKEDDSKISPYTLQALVSHFQKLFDVPSLNGVYPRMNEVYSRLGEVNNAMKNLRNILGLDDSASVGMVVNVVWGMCRNTEGENSWKLQDILGPLDIDSIINKVQEHEEFFPAFEGLVKGLLDILGIHHLEEILPEVLRLKELNSH
ncbi:centrosomal protein of 70 kDa isoform X2 [Pyxicephalus adspersus]|uniref:Centrosomal protein of 70 kDa n=1 Tax=Pyxicephalus adspersus TaxID=30357 RepID=A0AAV2ZZ21_PYXAD|nr:TPA: hypothetical protein GDO54_015350 [Pyxicephalus adspersus]